MIDLSIIIPSRDEPYLDKTLNDLLEKAVKKIEIFVNIDGDLPETLVLDKRITYFHKQEPIGMRAGINAGLKKATGKYIMKCDAHCLFAKGFDKVLTENMQEKWLVVPRRYSLHAEGWKRDKRMPLKDYHYLSWPKLYSSYGHCMFPQEWRERMIERFNGYDIDDTMTMQGSCWFANRDYFMKRVGFLDDSPNTYSGFSGEQLEVGLKYWLGGGEMKVNKKTWYAHLFKNKKYYQGRRRAKNYKKNLKALAGWDWACKHWMRNEEPKMIHKISWLVEKFWPVPGWPEDRNQWVI